MKTNSAELWDSLWNDPNYRKDDLKGLEKEYLGIRWQRIAHRITSNFGGFEELNVIELGAGAGKVAALFAKHGADVTVLDYSEGALERARQLFQRLDLDATFIHEDALSLPDALLSRFDVSMSFGLTEHFLDERRVAINRAHLDVLRPGGLALIAVPNKFNPPYRMYKAVAERLGTWRYGEEYPYSRGEFESICEKIGVNDYEFLGDSFWDSFRFINPLGNIRDKLGLKRKQEHGSFLDAYVSYSLVLCARKPATAGESASQRS